MTELDKILGANEEYYHNFRYGALPIPPARKLAILACMDARLNVNEVLGLGTGDAHIIRNAGGIATDDAIRYYKSHRLRNAQIYRHGSSKRTDRKIQI